MHYVYILHSAGQDIYYKGYSQNPEQRLRYHNNGNSRFTSGRGPWELVFLKSFERKTEALSYETMLKRQNHRYLKWLIDSDKNEL